jgi:benzoylformate decarboxylase
MWSKPFANRHPLFLGGFQREMRFAGPVDVILNLGGRLPWGERIPRGTTLMQVRMDADNLARTAPTDVAIVAHPKLALADLLAAVRSLATETRLKQIREPRLAKAREYTTRTWEFRQAIAREEAAKSPSEINHYHLALELERVLEKDACYVTQPGSGRKMENLISLGGAGRQYFQSSGGVLGWALPAAFGVKLARPDQQVVAVVGDGSALFSGLQPLWTFARYKAPVTVIILNNSSYNEERNRLMSHGGRQFETGLDMACYHGDPEIDHAKTAASYGVEGEVVTTPAQVRGALERAVRANIEGRPYLLDIHVERAGLVATSTWHPPYSLADLRRRKI